MKRSCPSTELVQEVEKLNDSANVSTTAMKEVLEGTTQTTDSVQQQLTLMETLSGSMSILWAQKVELFSQHNICRENYFLGC